MLDIYSLQNSSSLLLYFFLKYGEVVVKETKLQVKRLASLQAHRKAWKKPLILPVLLVGRSAPNHAELEDDWNPERCQRMLGGCRTGGEGRRAVGIESHQGIEGDTGPTDWERPITCYSRTN